MKCLNCGTEQTGAFTYCDQCGAALEAPQPPVAQANPPEPAAEPGVTAQPLAGPGAEPQFPAEPDAPAQPFYGQETPTPSADASPQPPVGPDAPYPYDGQPGAAMPYQPYAMAGGPPIPGAPARKKGKMLVAILVAAAILLAIIAGVLVFLVDFRSPTQKLRDAMDNTWQTLNAEWQATGEELNFGQAGSWLRDGPAVIDYDVDVSLAIQGPIGSASLSGQIRSNLPDGRFDMELGIGTGGLTLAQMNIAKEGDVVAFSLPDLIDGSYGVNLSTLMEDLAALDPSFAAIPEQLDGYYRELQQQGAALAAPQEAQPERQAEMDAIVDELWAGVQVQADGRADTEVNGVALSCERFIMTVEKDAVISYLRNGLDAVLGAYSDATGLSAGVMAGFDDLKAMLEDALDTMEDELSGVAFTGYGYNDRLVKLEGVLGSESSGDLDVLVEIGGERNLSDAFTVELTDSEGKGFRLTGEGNQVITDGVYSRTIELVPLGDDMEGSVVFDVWYDTAAEQDNFKVSLTSGDADTAATPSLAALTIMPSFTVEGTVLVDPAARTMTMDLYDIRLFDGLGTTIEASFEYSVEAAAELDFEPVDPIMLLELSQEERDALLNELLMALMQSGMAGQIL